MLEIGIVFVTYELADLLRRRELRSPLVGPRSRQNTGILNCNFDLHVPEIRTAVTLDNVQLVCMRMPVAVQPYIVDKVDAIDHQRVSLPMADRVAIPQRIRLFRVLVTG